MGQLRNIYYNLGVIVLVGLVWAATTFQLGNLPYSYKLGQLKGDGYLYNIQPLVVSIVIGSDSELEVDNEVQKNIESVINSFSVLVDIEANVQVFVGEEINSNSKRTLVHSGKTEMKIVFSLLNHCLGLCCISDCSEIPGYLIAALREKLGLKGSTGLINGLTEDEFEYGNTHNNYYYLNLVKSSIYKYNELIYTGYPYLTEFDRTVIDSIKRQLQNPAEGLPLKALYFQLYEINSRLSLYKESYFQWDFKLGVYAPIFIPSLFPLGGALYYRVFIKKLTS